jgi:hypothetical protein
LLCACYLPQHGQAYQKIGSSAKNMRNLRKAFQLAQKMGGGLERGPVLFGALQAQPSEKRRLV